MPKEFDDSFLFDDAPTGGPEEKPFDDSFLFDDAQPPGEPEITPQTEVPGGIIESAKRGLSVGYNQVQALAGGVKMLLGDTIGDEELTKSGLEIYQRNMAEAEAYAPRIQRIEDIKSGGDFVDWFSGAVPQLLPAAATMLGTGGVGGLVGKAVGKRLIDKTAAELIKKSVQKKALTAVEKAVVEKSLKIIARSTIAGEVTGAMAGSSGLEMGSIYGETVTDPKYQSLDEEGKSRAIKSAIVGGIAAGSLDAIPVMRFAKRFGFAGGLSEKIAKKLSEMKLPSRMLYEGTTQSGIEAGTEVLQSAVERAAKEYALENKLSLDLSPEALSEYMNAAAMGAAGGFAFGGLGGIPKPAAPEDDVQAQPEAIPPVKPESYVINQPFGSALDAGPLDANAQAEAIRAEVFGGETTPEATQGVIDTIYGEQPLTQADINQRVINAAQTGTLETTLKEVQRAEPQPVSRLEQPSYPGGIDYQAPDISPTTTPGAAPEPVASEGIPFPRETPEFGIETKREADRRVKQDKAISDIEGELGNAKTPDGLNDPRIKRLGHRRALAEFADKIPGDQQKKTTEIDPSVDDVLVAVAKAGGINRAEAVQQGIDPEHFKDKTRIFGRPLFPKTGGMSMDGLAETLNQFGYLEAYDANEMLDKVMTGLSGEAVYSREVDHGTLISLENLRENSEGMTPKQVRTAVSKALAGGKLGKKQARVVKNILDSYTAERTDPENIYAARQERARKLIKQLPVEYQDELNREIPEKDYPEAPSDDAILFYEWAERALDAGANEDIVEKIIEDTGIGKMPEVQAVKALIQLTREKPDETGQEGRGLGTEEAEGKAEEKPFGLKKQTKEDIQAREQAAEDARKAEADADSRAEADKAAKGFKLTGSKREADMAAAVGQKDLLAPGAATKEEISSAASDAEGHTASEAQIEGNNYKKGHIYNLQGMKISVENEAGTQRRPEWPPLAHHYGDITGTVAADGDPIDVFIKKDTDIQADNDIYVINQNVQGTDKFDEIKVMLGFSSEADAKKGYLDSYTSDFDGFGSIVKLTPDEFKAWLDGDTTKPVTDIPVKQPITKKAPIKTELVEKKEPTDEEVKKVIGESEIAKRSKTQEKAKQDEANASEILTAANVVGTERLEIMSKFRAGEYSLDDLKAAYKTEVEKVVPEKEKPAEKITDVGEKIGGARKDVWSGFREKVSEEISNDEILSLPLSKVFPEPDYKKLAENGADPISLAAIKVLREEIPRKPNKRWKYKQKAYIDAVNMLRDASLQILDDPNYAEKWINGLRESKSLSGLADRVDLMIELGFPGNDIDIKGVTLKEVFYSLYNGEKNVKKWVVDDTAKSRRSLGGMGGQIAAVDTREEAVESLKDHLLRVSKLPKGKRVTKFDIYKYRDQKDRGWIVGKKTGRNYIDLKEGFETSGEARKYIEDNQSDLESELKKRKEVPAHRRPVNEVRLGEDYRGGKDVSPEEFMDTFGFRGVEFGNWVNQVKRQDDINDAYDGLMDLAKMIDIPPKAISLNGELGIAFGARGKGGKEAFKAHYEPDKIVINLTKKDGAGSLGHEWFHGMDNYFSRMRGEGKSYLTERPYELMDKSVRKEMIDKFKGIMKTIKASGLPKRAANLDKTKAKPYWSTDIEMAARAFESYIINKLKEKNLSNDYLANIVSPEYWEASEKLGMESADSYPYIMEDEQAKINEAYDDFFNEIKTKETDKGTMIYEASALYSGYDPTPTTVQIREPSGAESEQGTLDLFAPTEVPSKTAATQSEDNFDIKYKQVEVGQLNVGTTNVEYAADAAHIVAPIRKHAQETMLAVVIGADGKVLNVIRHTKGQKDSASVSVVELAAAVGATDGAKKVVFAHNHPTGDVKASAPDKNITGMLSKGLEGSGIDVLGHIIVGKGTEYNLLDSEGESSGRGKIPPFVRGKRVSVTERVIRKRKSTEKDQIVDAQSAIDEIRKLGTRNGLLLLNNKNQPIGIISMSPEEIAGLRETGQIPRILKAIDSTNAAAGIIISEKTESVQNLGNYLARLSGFRALDAILVENEVMQSLVSKMIISDKSEPFYSRSTTQVWSALSKDDEIFRYAKSDSSDLNTIISEVAPKFKIDKQSNIPDDVESAWKVSLKKDPDKTGFIIKYKNGFVNLNVLNFDKNDGGSALYAATGNYAENNNLVFSGDILGMNKTSMFRRMEYAISHALKYGNTDSILLHPDQVITYGIKWKKGDTENNLREMLKASRDEVVKYADISGVTFDFESDTFIRDGKPISESEISAIAEKARSKGLSTGATTIKRAIMTSTIEQSGVSLGVTLPEAYKGALYSKAKKATSKLRSSISSARKSLISRFGENAIDSLEKTGVLNILNNENELPAHLDDGRGGIKGVYDPRTDKVYIVAGNVTAEEMPGLLLHELGEHYGMEKMLGAELYRQVLKQAKGMINLGHKGMAAAKLRVPANTAQENVDSETLAYFLQDNANAKTSLFKRIISAIRAFLFRHGFSINLTDTDIQALAVSAIRASVRKSKPVRAGDFAPQMAKQDPMFYSQMQSVLADKLPGKAPANQYLKTIQAFTKKGQFKQEEYEWSGIEEWLAPMLGKKLTKTEVLDFLKANEIQVQEVIKGKPYLFNKVDSERLNYLLNKPEGEWDGSDYSGGAPLTDAEKQELDELKAKQTQTVQESKKTKFPQYQLPGGENYREMLLTLPSRNIKYREMYAEFLKKMQGKYNSRDRRSFSEEDKNRYDELNKLVDSEEGKPVGDIHKSSHYDEPNIFAHIRFNERADADGKRVLFIEEVQSDWMQTGRKMGFKKKARPVRDRLAQEYNLPSDTLDWNGEKLSDAGVSDEDIGLWGKEIAIESGGVPDAPFKTTWPLLAMKRMIRYASENGFDSIAWTTGEHQIERYDLSKQVDTIESEFIDDLYGITAYKGSEELLNEWVNKKELSDLVGKDLADKIIKYHSGGGKIGSFSGEDLKVGGKGMIGFYDNMLPKMVNKYVKKWGAKVGETEIEIEVGGDKSETEWVREKGYLNKSKVHSLIITEKMREAALSGQPMFSRGEEPSGARLGMPEETRTGRWQRWLQDSFNRIKTLQETIEKKGGKVTSESDVYLAEERHTGKITDRLKKLDRNHMKRLVKMMADSGATLDELDEYLMNRHAKERNDYIASIRDDMQDGGSGIKNKDAKDYLKALSPEKTKVLEAAAEVVYEVNRQTLSDLVEGGHLKQETVDEWQKRWKYYVPLKGKEGEQDFGGKGVGFSVKGSGILDALGRGEGNIAESPTAHAFAQAESTIVRTEKTKVGQALVQLMRDNPDPDFWTISQRTFEKFEDLYGEPFEGYEDAPTGLRENIDYHAVKATTKAERKLAKAEGRKPRSKVVYMLDPKYRFRDDVFAVMVEGEELLINIKDELVAEQLKKMNSNKLNAVVAGAGQVNRYLAMINTALNPEFVITNFERDFGQAMINLSGEQSAAMAAKVAKLIPSAMRGIWQSTFDTKGQSEMRDLFDELQAEGGTIGFFGLEDLQTKVKNIQNRLENSQTVLGKGKRGIMTVRDVILDANLAVENASRLAAYKVAKEQWIANGMTEKEAKMRAASLAKNLTVNFNRKGELAPVLNSMYLFYNASIQGSARIFTALKNKRVQKIVGGVMVTSFALALFNREVGGDDDDGKPYYDKISDYIKQTNMIFMHPDGSGNYTKIKMPYGYNVFWYTGVALNDLMYREDRSVIEVGLALTSTAMNAFNPIQGSDLLDTITPTVMKPFEQSARNINFMGGDIVPESPFDKYDRPDSQKKFKSTNPQLVSLMETINSLTGGDQTHSGIIDVSPETVKHYVGWLTGGAGLTATRTVGLAADIATGEPIEARNVPFVRTLGGKPGSRYDTERFYSAIREVEAVKAQMKIYRGTEKYRDYRAENRDIFRLSSQMLRYKGRIKRLRERRDRAYREGDHDLARDYSEQIRQQMMKFSSKYDEAASK